MLVTLLLVMETEKNRIILFCCIIGIIILRPRSAYRGGGQSCIAEAMFLHAKDYIMTYPTVTVVLMCSHLLIQTVLFALSGKGKVLKDYKYTSV